MQSQKLHPFFSRDPSSTTRTPASTTPSHDQPLDSTDHDAVQNDRRKRRKLSGSSADGGIRADRVMAPDMPHIQPEVKSDITYASTQNQDTSITAEPKSGNNVQSQLSPAMVESSGNDVAPTTPRDGESIGEGANDTSSTQITGRP